MNLQKETGVSSSWVRTWSRWPRPEEEELTVAYGEERLGDGTAVQGAMRSSGEPSPAWRGRKGKNAAAAMARLEVSRWRCGGEEEKTPCAPIYSCSPVTGAQPHGFRSVARSIVPRNSVVTAVAVYSKHMLGHRIGSGRADRGCRSTKESRRRGRLVKRTRIPGGSG